MLSIDIPRTPGHPEGATFSGLKAAKFAYRYSNDGGPYFFETNKEATKTDFSDAPKLLLAITEVFYHAVAEDMAYLFYVCDRYPKIKVFIKGPRFGSSKVFDYAINHLNKWGIDHEIIDEDDVVEVNNWLYHGIMHVNEQTVKALQIAFNETLGDVEPTDKIYISRKKANAVQSSQIDDAALLYLKHHGFDDLRIDNEALVEQYFEQNGFKVIYAEEFETLDAHIQAIGRAKVVAAVFSSGLTSILMMQKGQLVMEFPVTVTEVEKETGITRRLLRNEHQATAYWLGLDYCTVGNYGVGSDNLDRFDSAGPDIYKILRDRYFPVATKRNAEQIINALTTRPHLKAVMES